MSISIHIDHIEQITITGTPAPSLRWHVGPVQQKGMPMPVEVTMTTEQQVRLSITPTTAGGDPATLDGPAEWTVDGACTLTPIDDTSTWVLASATIGDSVVTVMADADLGTGVVNLMDTATIHVQTPMAENLGMVADEPVLKA